MFKKILLIPLLVLMLVGCKFNNPVGPDEPIKADDVVQFQYVRTLPIINPSGTDPTHPMLYSDEFGGINMPDWQLVAKDTWQVETPLRYSSRLYHIWAGDGKVANEAVADTIYARVKGTLNWIKLSTSPNGITGKGKWADFYLDQNGITTPSN
jgi:hypothetical protein